MTETSNNPELEDHNNGNPNTQEEEQAQTQPPISEHALWACLDNLLNDISSLRRESSNMQNLKDRGYDVGDVSIRLEQQANDTLQFLHEKIEEIKLIASELKIQDDRIHVDVEPPTINDMYSTTPNNIDRVRILVEFLSQLSRSLSLDLSMLEEARNTISRFKRLGITLNTAIEEIITQENVIREGLTNASKQLDTIFEAISLRSQVVDSQS